MKRGIFYLIVLFCFAVVSEAGFSQEPVKEPESSVQKVEEKKSSEKDLTLPVGLSGKMYLEMKVDTLKSGKEATTFALTRAYLCYQRVLWGPFSFKILSDVGTGLKSNDKAGTVEVSGQSYEFFIKNAYIQAAHDWKFLALNAKFGIIPTPAVDMVTKLQDLRWIYNEYSFSKAVDVLSNNDNTHNKYIKDNPADVGASLTTRIFSYVELNYAITIGEGYKHPVEVYDGKAHYGTISVIPYKGIYLNGFVHYSKRQSSQAYFYYGTGAAYNSKFLKTGANFLIHGEKNTGVKAEKYHVIEGWVNFFLGYFVPKAPVILAGRCAFGKHIENTEKYKRLLAGGAGYQFNEHFRVMAYYESYKRDDEAGAAAFYVKTEAKF